MEIIYEQSGALLTDTEKIANIKGRNELGLESRVTMLMKLDGLTEQEAIDAIEIVDRTKDDDIIIPIEEEENEEE